MSAVLTFTTLLLMNKSHQVEYKTETLKYLYEINVSLYKWALGIGLYQVLTRSISLESSWCWKQVHVISILHVK